MDMILEKCEVRKRSPRPRSPPRRKQGSSINITVPNHLVARLIGRSGENVKNIMNKTGCSISFMREVSSTQDYADVKTPEGSVARICTFRGSPSSIADGLKVLLDQVSNIEKQDLK